MGPLVGCRQIVPPQRIMAIHLNRFFAGWGSWGFSTRLFIRRPPRKASPRCLITARPFVVEPQRGCDSLLALLPPFRVFGPLVFPPLALPFPSLDRMTSICPPSPT